MRYAPSAVHISGLQHPNLRNTTIRSFNADLYVLLAVILRNLLCLHCIFVGPLPSSNHLAASYRPPFLHPHSGRGQRSAASFESRRVEIFLEEGLCTALLGRHLHWSWQKPELLASAHTCNDVRSVRNSSKLHSALTQFTEKRRAHRAPHL